MTEPRRRARRLGTGLLTLALGLVLSGTLIASPAAAAEPVTNPDTGKMWAGNAVVADVLANDSDADGDDLAICRIGESPSRKLEAFVDGDQLIVLSAPGARPGQYVFTYYACDFETLQDETLTITIKPKPRIRVVKLDAPGKLKIKNREGFRIELLYGSFREPQPDGTAIVGGHDSKVIRVHRTKINWIAFHARKGDFLRIGRVKNIQLPPGDHPPAAGRAAVSPRVAELWRSH
jgi:Bacterial Ig domain